VAFKGTSGSIFSDFSGAAGHQQLGDIPVPFKKQEARDKRQEAG